MDIDDKVDTVTPLDGDGTGVGEPQGMLAPQSDNVAAEDYESKGKTTVATRRGYAFQPEDPEIPVITHKGITTNKDTAEALVEESGGMVFIKNEED